MPSHLNVLVHGAYTAQSAVEARVQEELQIHQIGMLLGGGRGQVEVVQSGVWGVVCEQNNEGMEGKVSSGAGESSWCAAEREIVHGVRGQERRATTLGSVFRRLRLTKEPSPLRSAGAAGQSSPIRGL